MGTPPVAVAPPPAPPAPPARVAPAFDSFEPHADRAASNSHGVRTVVLVFTCRSIARGPTKCPADVPAWSTAARPAPAKLELAAEIAGALVSLSRPTRLLLRPSVLGVRTF